MYPQLGYEMSRRSFARGVALGAVGPTGRETSIGSLGYETSSAFDLLSGEVSHHERSVRDHMTIKSH
jgi:hypothetical protein